MVFGNSSSQPKIQFGSKPCPNQLIPYKPPAIYHLSFWPHTIYTQHSQFSVIVAATAEFSSQKIPTMKTVLMWGVPDREDRSGNAVQNPYFLAPIVVY